MDPAELQAIADKAERGEALTAEETQALMSSSEEPPTRDANLNDEEPPVDVKIKGLPEGVAPPPAKPEEGKGNKPAEADPGAKKDPKDTATPADKKGEGSPADPAKAKTEGEKVEQSGLDDAAVARVKDALNQENPNLDGFTPREKGLYFDLKSERASRQEAETRARTAEFELKKAQKKLKELETGETQPDLEEENTPEKQLMEARREVFNTRLELDRIKQSSLPHFEEAIAMADAGWITDQAKKSLVQQAMNGLLKGQSPYKVTYDLITSDPRWEAKKAELDAKKNGASGAPSGTDAAKKKAEEEAKIKADEAKAAAKALEDNKRKAKTPEDAGGAGGDELLEYDAEKLYAMSDAEFGKLKPEVQESILRKLSMAG